MLSSGFGYLTFGATLLPHSSVTGSVVGTLPVRYI